MATVFNNVVIVGFHLQSSFLWHASDNLHAADLHVEATPKFCNDEVLLWPLHGINFRFQWLASTLQQVSSANGDCWMDVKRWQNKLLFNRLGKPVLLSLLALRVVDFTNTTCCMKVFLKANTLNKKWVGVRNMKLIIPRRNASVSFQNFCLSVSLGTATKQSDTIDSLPALRSTQRCCCCMRFTKYRCKRKTN